MTEKKIEGYERYTVDEYGNVRSYVRDTPLKLKHTLCDGYPRVSLSNGSETKSLNIHRLVAKAFIPNPDNKPCVNHINSTRNDNRVVNLEWATYSENNKHAKDYGYNPSMHGEDTSCASMSNAEAREIYLYLLEGYRNIDAVNKFGYNLAVVTGIKSKNTYSVATHDLPPMDLLPHSSKISENTVRWICSKLSEGLSSQQVFDLSTNKKLRLNVIKDIKRRKTYKVVSSEYVW